MERIYAIGCSCLIACMQVSCSDESSGATPNDVLDQVATDVADSQVDHARPEMIDILFVINNSSSMCEEQQSLIDNIYIFINGLHEINADFHLAVTTTDMSSDNGRIQIAPGDPGIDCADSPPLECSPSTGPVLRVTDYLFDPTDFSSELDASSLRRDFSCIARVGVDGSTFAKGLDAMLAAFSPELADTTNSGFRRQSAWLAIVFVSDENDCSDGDALTLESAYDCEWLRDDLTPVEYFIEEIVQVDGEGTDISEQLLVAGLIGPDDGQRPVSPDTPLPSCSGDLGDAYPGYRYEEFISSFGERGLVGDICRGSFSHWMTELVSLFSTSLEGR